MSHPELSRTWCLSASACDGHAIMYFFEAGVRVFVKTLPVGEVHGAANAWTEHHELPELRTGWRR